MSKPKADPKEVTAAVDQWVAISRQLGYSPAGAFGVALAEKDDEQIATLLLAGVAEEIGENVFKAVDFAIKNNPAFAEGFLRASKAHVFKELLRTVESSFKEANIPPEIADEFLSRLKDTPPENLKSTEMEYRELMSRLANGPQDPEQDPPTKH